MWRLLRLVPPETAHNITFWILDKQERWDGVRWTVFEWLDVRVGMIRMRQLRRDIPLV